MIIKEAIQAGHAIVNNSLVVNMILSHVIKKEKSYLISHSEERLENIEYKRFVSLLHRIQTGEPAAYIIGKKEFFYIDFFVDKNVLIPRPETEHLVEEIIGLVKRNFGNRRVRILDMGTGSGNIAVSLALNIKNSLITAADVSKPALAVAKKNIKRHMLEDKIKLVYSDLLNEINDEFDIIVANLPYIGRTENNFIAKEVENNEPHLALFGGANGLELYAKLFTQIRKKNCVTGYLLGEIGFSQKKGLNILLKKHFPLFNYRVSKDLAGFDRYFVVNCYK
ncbi:peptide chain release factor N(5)-glutamine methyltransferase [Candidatus Peregrinibacteria bacterium]|nr:peptide chain release factor N(5)-glutamine methyltransferase [Candidatus Peregrinibacteria bacterium]